VASRRGDRPAIFFFFDELTFWREGVAFSGHKTLAMVKLYTDAADKKRLADSGFAKTQRTKGDENYTNIDTPLHKQGKKTRKIKG
jgi:hypothetical protein